MSKKSNKISVFYDGACGLCAKEIAYYKTIAPADTFDWVDVARDAKSFLDLGYKQSEGLKALHALDRSDQMHIGVDAFILIWRQLSGWKILAWFASLPVIKQIAAFLYKHFANWRFKRLGYTE